MWLQTMQHYLEDEQRLTWLEEVRGKLGEISLIAVRIGDVKLDPQSVRKFAPRLIFGLYCIQIDLPD